MSLKDLLACFSFSLIYNQPGEKQFTGMVPNCQIKLSKAWSVLSACVDRLIVSVTRSFVKR